VDGLLIGSSIYDADLTAEMLEGVPAIIIGDPAPPGLAVPAVVTDQHSGAREATQHLLDLGHPTVHHIAGPLAWHSARSRRDAWRSTLERAQATVPDVIAGTWSARSGYQAAQHLLARNDHSPVTAIFAANDSMAVGALRALAEAGRRVPDDVCVVGFDDFPEAEFLPVPLSTVRQDFVGMTRRAVTELSRAIAGEPVEPRITTDPELVIRASSTPAGSPR
jgi:DNA-binding LacI/PurR family transcriptional regulator